VRIGAHVVCGVELRADEEQSRMSYGLTVFRFRGSCPDPGARAAWIARDFVDVSRISSAVLYEYGRASSA
jgi:hypothetical protein